MCDLLLLPGIKEFNERTVNIVTIWVNNCSLKIYEKILREKCPYSEFFWSLFSRIRTEYREIFHISDQKTPNMDSFHAVRNFRMNFRMLIFNTKFGRDHDKHL